MNTQKYGFIGPVAATIIGPIVGKVMEALMKSPSVPVDAGNARSVEPAVQDAVREAVREEVTPRIEHLTNNEPAIFSRVTQGSVGAAIVAAGSLVTMWTQGTLTIEAGMTQGAIIVGAVWALYGRWVATKPVGS